MHYKRLYINVFENVPKIPFYLNRCFLTTYFHATDMITEKTKILVIYTFS